MIQFPQVDEIDEIRITSAEVIRCLYEESRKGIEEQSFNLGERIVLLWGSIRDRILEISYCTPQYELEETGIVVARPHPPLFYGFDIVGGKYGFCLPSGTEHFSIILFTHRHPIYCSRPSELDFKCSEKNGVGIVWCDALASLTAFGDEEEIMFFTAYGRTAEGEDKELPVRCSYLTKQQMTRLR